MCTSYCNDNLDCPASFACTPLDSGGAMSFGFERVMVAPDDPPLVVFEGLQFMTDAPEASIATDVQLREGQQAVVGKASLGKGQGAMILVLEIDVLRHDEP